MPGFICGVAVCVANPPGVVGVADAGNQITVAVGSGVSEGRGVAVRGVASRGRQAARSENPNKRNKCENFM